MGKTRWERAASFGIELVKSAFLHLVFGLGVFGIIAIGLIIKF